MAVFRTGYRLDVFMKRIVLLVGGVETLAYFSIQMGNEWKRMGYNVFYLNSLPVNNANASLYLSTVLVTTSSGKRKSLSGFEMCIRDSLPATRSLACPDGWSAHPKA